MNLKLSWTRYRLLILLLSFINGSRIFAWSLLCLYCPINCGVFARFTHILWYNLAFSSPAQVCQCSKIFSIHVSCLYHSAIGCNVATEIYFPNPQIWTIFIKINFKVFILSSWSMKCMKLQFLRSKCAINDQWGVFCPQLWDIKEGAIFLLHTQ